MGWHGLIPKLRSLLLPRQTERDLADELAAHVELQTRKYLERGFTDEEARRRACLEFGSFAGAQEQCRETNRWNLVDTCARNLRHAYRSLRKTPSFAVIAIAVLAIGIGSTLAIFALADALLFRPLPVKNASELVRIASVGRDGDLESLPTTLLEPLSRLPEYQGVCGFDTNYTAVEWKDAITSAGTLGFSGDCFSTLGIGVQRGRSLIPEDDRIESAPVAVITDAFWQREFDRRPDALGQRLTMEGRTYTVVGVAESRFNGLLVGFPAAVIVPAHQRYGEAMPNGRIPTYWWVNVLARRAPAISEQQAAIRLNVRAQKLLEESVPPHFNASRRKDYLARRLLVSPGANGIDYFLKRRFGGFLYAAAGICSVILLIGCINLANVLLARSLRRGREVAIRFALGASRSQVAGLFATESLLLVVAGAALGSGLARLLNNWLESQGARMFGNFDLGLSFDWRIAVFLAAIVSLVTTAFAAISAWQADRFRGPEAMRQGGHGLVSTQSPVQRVLIALQIAFTLALVASAGLFSTSLKNLYALNLGVKTSHVWDVMLSTRPGTKAYFDRGPYYRELLEEVRSLPGVRSASLTDFLPFFTVPDPQLVAAIDTGRAQQQVNAYTFNTSADLFRALGIKILAGEGLDEKADGEPAVVVSESLALRLAKSPREIIGHHVRFGLDSRYQRLRVSGVVSNAQMDLAHPEDLAPPVAYMNIWQHPDAQGYPVLLIKTSGNHLDVGSLRKIVDSKGHEYVDRVRTLDSEKDGALMENKLIAYLSGAFSTLALVMAAAGLFGLLSYQVASRAAEIGIRLAVGASRWQIQWMILRQILTLVGIGCAAGIVLSATSGRVLASLLYGVSPYNVPLLLLSCGVLAFVSLTAAWLPLRGASLLNPLMILRHE